MFQTVYVCAHACVYACFLSLQVVAYVLMSFTDASALNFSLGPTLSLAHMHARSTPAHCGSGQAFV